MDKDGGSVDSEGEAELGCVGKVEGGSPGDVGDMGMRMASRFLTWGEGETEELLMVMEKLSN